jgi:hypothetical protein
MAFTIMDTFLGYPKIAATSTAPWIGGGTLNTTPPLGTIVSATDPTYGTGKFIFLKGVASTAVGSWVTYNDDDYSTTLLAANAIGPVAVAMSANVASQYGWYQIQGKAIGKALTGFVDNANVYATATAGSVDDAVVAGDRVKNAKGASAVDTPSTGLAEFEIDYPVMDDGLAA